MAINKINFDGIEIPVTGGGGVDLTERVEALEADVDDLQTQKANQSALDAVSSKTNSNETMLNSLAVEVTNAKQDIEEKVGINNVYPIGSVYLTVATSTTGAVSPASFFGGTWERLPEGKALWTAGDNIIVDDPIDAGLPQHYHAMFQSDGQNTDITTESYVSMHRSTGGAAGYTMGQKTDGEIPAYGKTGNASDSIYGNSTTVQPPAYTIYAWKRIA